MLCHLFVGGGVLGDCSLFVVVVLFYGGGINKDYVGLGVVPPYL